MARGVNGQKVFARIHGENSNQIIEATERQRNEIYIYVSFLFAHYHCKFVSISAADREKKKTKTAPLCFTSCLHFFLCWLRTRFNGIFRVFFFRSVCLLFYLNAFFYFNAECLFAPPLESQHVPFRDTLRFIRIVCVFADGMKRTAKTQAKARKRARKTSDAQHERMTCEECEDKLVQQRSKRKKKHAHTKRIRK